MTNLHDLRAWEIQPGEPTRCFALFQVFLGLSRRSVRAAVQEHARREGRPIPKATPGNVTKTSVLWRWIARAEAFDRFRAEEERADEEKARRDVRAARRRRLRELARQVEKSLPTLHLEDGEIRDTLRALEIVAAEERNEFLDEAVDRRERPEHKPELPDLVPRLIPYKPSGPADAPQKETAMTENLENRP